MPQGTVFFISTMDGSPWGGSEELWAGTAKRLVADGFDVKACVRAWTPMHPRVAEVAKAGVDLRTRPFKAPLLEAIARKLRRSSYRWDGLRVMQKMLTQAAPDLVVLSEGANLPPVELIEFLASTCPFVTISHNNFEYWWPEDDVAARYRQALSAAVRCYFVSEKNRRLAENQIGCELTNSAIVKNPFNVPFDVSVDWPSIPADQELTFACVGRLDPRAKGQDLLIEALAGQAWSTRQWRLMLYGNGPMKGTLERLVLRMGLKDRVVFAGHVDRVQEIWGKSHILVQPSRHEGLPLTIVEAMLCGRPVLATDVAGNPEVVLDGITGFLADAPTVSSVADALERVWIQRAELQKLGQNAANSIRSTISSDPVADFAKELREIMGTISRKPR